jgi:hypothetical protein
MQYQKLREVVHGRSNLQSRLHRRPSCAAGRAGVEEGRAGAGVSDHRRYMVEWRVGRRGEEQAMRVRSRERRAWREGDSRCTVAEGGVGMRRAKCGGGRLRVGVVAGVAHSCELLSVSRWLRAGGSRTPVSVRPRAHLGGEVGTADPVRAALEARPAEVLDVGLDRAGRRFSVTRDEKGKGAHS